MNFEIQASYEYVSQGSFDSATKRKYYQLLDDYQNKLREPSNCVDAFIKTELLLKKTTPRRIQARDHLFKLLTAPVMNQLTALLE